MLLTPANLNQLFTAYDMRFWQAFGKAPKFSDKIATTIPCGTEIMGFAWIGALDKMREWVGPRVAHEPAAETYFVKPAPFELTEKISKYKVLDDTYGVYNPVIDAMGRSVAKNFDYQLRDLMRNLGTQIGARQIGTDGLTHWNTAHPIDLYDAGKGTYCNDFTGGVVIDGVTVGGAFGVNSYATLRQEFMARKDQSGEALGLMPNLGLFPSQLELTAKYVLQAEYLAAPTLGNLTGQVGAAENMNRNSADLLIAPEFNGAPTVWYLLDTQSAPFKPFLIVERQAPETVIRNQASDPVVFDTASYLYGVDSRMIPAFGHPFLSAKSAP